MKLILSVLFLYLLAGCHDYIKSDFNSPLDPESPYYIPGRPDPITIKKIAFDHITVGWNDNSQKEAGFFLVRRFEPANDFFAVYLDTFQLPPNTVQFIDSFKVSQLDRLIYYLAAFNDYGLHRENIFKLLEIEFPRIDHIYYEFLDTARIKLKWEQDSIYENTCYEMEFTFGGDWIFLDTLKADTREYSLDLFRGQPKRKIYGIRIKTIYGSWKTYGTEFYIYNLTANN